MGDKGTKIIVGIGIGIAIYFILNNVVKKAIMQTPPKEKSIEPESSFAGFSKESSGYEAMQFDPEHINEDGSRGATWIGFERSDIVGFWKKGAIKGGTKVFI